MAKNTEPLALAYYFSGKEVYAAQAAKFLPARGFSIRPRG